MPHAIRAVKGYYFAFFAAIAMASPYFSLYLREHCGLTDRQIGVLVMIGPTIGLVMVSVWGLVADATRSRARVTSLLVLAAGLTYPLLLLVTDFWYLALLLVAHHMFCSPSIALADSVAFEQLGSERRSMFGNLRVYGTVGFLISLLIFGPVLESLGLKFLFPVVSVNFLLAAVFMSRIGPGGASSHVEGMSMLRILYSNRNLLILLVALFIGVMAMLAPFPFLSIYARKLGANNTHISWLFAVSVIPEVVVMHYAGRIARRVGVKLLIIVGLAGVGLRWIPMAYMTAWWQLLPLQLMHGVAFGCVYVGAVTFADIESPPRVRSSAQALLSMVAIHLGRVVGYPLCGEICERWGYSTMLVVYGILGLVACLIVLVGVHEPRGHSEDGADAVAGNA